MILVSILKRKVNFCDLQPGNGFLDRCIEIELVPEFKRNNFRGLLGHFDVAFGDSDDPFL